MIRFEFFEHLWDTKYLSIFIFQLEKITFIDINIEIEIYLLKVNINLFAKWSYFLSCNCFVINYVVSRFCMQFFFINYKLMQLRVSIGIMVSMDSFNASCQLLFDNYKFHYSFSINILQVNYLYTIWSEIAIYIWRINFTYIIRIYYIYEYNV